ncbi:hypothetical protein FEZ63_20660 [Microvirga brassicacearum]|uniref:Uncharacterized protein n=1 Tax=Microvirga brassicacearum TaxID=2580413 RepID=A0A5N3P5F2_9HYPH|nr:hypothetical protein FEZ63_20660 [Microvirga brassicacearum]
MHLVHNEQTKLTATAINNVAVAFVIAGFVGPAVCRRVRFGSHAYGRRGHCREPGLAFRWSSYI